MLDGQHEVSPAESETVASAVLEEAPGAKRPADFQVIQRITSFHSTPLPDAETLNAYARVIPNGAERIMSLIEREAAHRHRQDLDETRHIARGHWMAYSLALALSCAGVYLGAMGHDLLAATLFMTTIGAVVTTLVADRKARVQVDKENALRPRASE